MPDLGLEVLWKGKNFVRLLGGLWVALRISLIAAAVSVAAGVILGIAASRKRSAASAILRVWLGIIHIMPQMVLLFLMKETSVFSAVSLMDLMFTAKDQIGLYYKTVESLFLLVSAYLLILLPLSLLGSLLERRLRRAGFGT